MSVLLMSSKGDVQRSLWMCSQDQHAQAQHWLRHAQAQLMHAQAQPYLISPRRRRGGAASLAEPDMHELSLSMPAPMLSLSMLILATYPSQHVSDCSEHRSARSESSARSERSERFWILGTLFGANTAPAPRPPKSMLSTGLRSEGICSHSANR